VVGREGVFYIDGEGGCGGGGSSGGGGRRLRRGSGHILLGGLRRKRLHLGRHGGVVVVVVVGGGGDVVCGVVVSVGGVGVSGGDFLVKKRTVEGEGGNALVDVYRHKINNLKRCILPPLRCAPLYSISRSHAAE